MGTPIHMTVSLFVCQRLGLLGTSKRFCIPSTGPRKAQENSSQPTTSSDAAHLPFPLPSRHAKPGQNLMAAAAGARRAWWAMSTLPKARPQAPLVSPRREVATAAAEAGRAQWAMSTLPNPHVPLLTPRREIAKAAAASARSAHAALARTQPREELFLFIQRRGTSTSANSGSTTSTGSTTPTVVQMSEELVKELKSEACGDKILGMAEDLHKALKDSNYQALVMSCKSEVTMEAIKMSQIESSISEIKATAKLNSTVMFTICGIFGCLLMAIPIRIYEIDAEAKNNEKKSQKRHEECEKKYQKLKTMIRAIENKRGADTAQKEESAKLVADTTQKEDAQKEDSWSTWVGNLLGGLSSPLPPQK
ncbi:unnamed protein product [Urochloa humidicola]